MNITGMNKIEFTNPIITYENIARDKMINKNSYCNVNNIVYSL